ncbi:MAG TPA: hypothetical protein VFZ67_01510 [Nitrososphaera sp.]
MIIVVCADAVGEEAAMLAIIKIAAIMIAVIELVNMSRLPD